MPHPVKYYSIIFGNRATEDVFCVHVFPQAREHRETQIPSQAREQSEAVQQEGHEAAAQQRVLDAGVRSEHPRGARLGGTPHLLQSQAVQKVEGRVFGMAGTASLPKDPFCQGPCSVLVLCSTSQQLFPTLLPPPALFFAAPQVSPPRLMPFQAFLHLPC